MPKTILELVSLDVANLISSNSSLSSTTPASFDTNRAKKLILDLTKRSQRVLPSNGDASGAHLSTVSSLSISYSHFRYYAASWSEQLSQNLDNLIRDSSTPMTIHAGLVRQATYRLLQQHSPERIVFQILSRLLSLTPTLPNPLPRTLTPEDEQDLIIWTRIERAGSGLFSESPSLLYSFVNDVLPAFLSNSSFHNPAKDPVERTKVEMLSDILGGAFTLSLAGAREKEKARVVLQLDRLAGDLVSLLSKKSAPSEEEDLDTPMLAKVFVDRLTSYKPLLAASKQFSLLSSPSL